MEGNFSAKTKTQINSFLKSLKNELYDASTKLNAREVTYGIPGSMCKLYIVRFEFSGMMFYNGYRNFDLMHICAKKDDTGLIDYIKVYPQKNSKAVFLVEKAQQAGNLFGLKISKIEEDTEYDESSSIVRIIKLYVS